MVNDDLFQSTNDVKFEDIINKDILILMGAENMPDEVKNELYNKMLRTIQNRTIARVTDILSDSNLDEWLSVAETDNPLKIEQYLATKKIDMNQLMLEESIKYKAQMVAISRNIRDAKKQQATLNTSLSGN